jgi:uncharacterized protein YqjF (DUF2071 family)
MAQTWRDLLFAHWPVPRQRLASVVPRQLQIESHSGSAWIGVTPFLISNLRLRGTTPVPLLSRFPELNVRTYVTVGGKPGIYFLSLDAARRSAVEAARRLYRLPYFHARMRRQVSDWGVNCSARRISADRPPAEFAASFSPTGGESPVAALRSAHRAESRAPAGDRGTGSTYRLERAIKRFVATGLRTISTGSPPLAWAAFRYGYLNRTAFTGHEL